MTKPIIGLDPGPVQSALVLLQGDRVLNSWYCPNLEARGRLRDLRDSYDARLVIEQIASFGMAVGAEVFETVYWSGIFAESYGLDQTYRLKRLDVKMALCHDSRAKDANIRAAILDLYGGKAAAMGNKKAPGPLYGISGDLWSALAVALAWSQINGRAASIGS
jgi:hypothetical protein